MYKFFKISIFATKAIAKIIAGTLIAFILLSIIYATPFVKPISTLMIYDFLRGHEIHRQWIKLDNIPPAIWQAVLASEDARFCYHHAIDAKEFAKVWQQAVKGKKTRGASTIAMQNAKNLFLWHGRSYTRKALEIPLAFISHNIWGRQRAMEIYLNIAEWGENIYGIGAAAQFHFGKDLTKLTPRQISLLAVSLPNPHSRHPAKPTNNLTKLAKSLEHRIRYSHEHNFCIQK